MSLNNGSTTAKPALYSNDFIRPKEMPEIRPTLSMTNPPRLTVSSGDMTFCRPTKPAPKMMYRIGPNGLRIVPQKNSGAQRFVAAKAGRIFEAPLKKLLQKITSMNGGSERQNMEFLQTKIDEISEKLNFATPQQILNFVDKSLDAKASNIQPAKTLHITKVGGNFQSNVILNPALPLDKHKRAMTFEPIKLGSTVQKNGFPKNGHLCHCAICKIVFRSRKTLLMHIRSIHRRDAVRCDICFKTFDHIQKLTKHFRRHTKARRSFIKNNDEDCEIEILDDKNTKIHEIDPDDSEKVLIIVDDEEIVKPKSKTVNRTSDEIKFLWGSTNSNQSFPAIHKELVRKKHKVHEKEHDYCQERKRAIIWSLIDKMRKRNRGGIVIQNKESRKIQRPQKLDNPVEQANWMDFGLEEEMNCFDAKNSWQQTTNSSFVGDESNPSESSSFLPEGGYNRALFPFNPNSNTAQLCFKRAIKPTSVIPVFTRPPLSSEFIKEGIHYVDCECKICGKIMSRKANAVKHILTMHVGCKVQCPICNKLFGQSGSLNSHINVVHNGIQQYSCDICGHSFAHKYNLSNHFRKHLLVMSGQSKAGNKKRTSDKYSVRACSYCHIEFTQPRLLYDHEKKAHKISIHQKYRQSIQVSKHLISHGQLVNLPRKSSSEEPTMEQIFGTLKKERSPTP